MFNNKDAEEFKKRISPLLREFESIIQEEMHTIQDEILATVTNLDRSFAGIDFMPNDYNPPRYNEFDQANTSLSDAVLLQHNQSKVRRICKIPNSLRS